MKTTGVREPNRWVQLVIGIVSKAIEANLQYAWTLFVNPIQAKNHWGLPAIQLAFSIFVVIETWLVPNEKWAVDKFGPRPVVAFGAILAGRGGGRGARAGAGAGRGGAAGGAGGGAG